MYPVSFLAQDRHAPSEERVLGVLGWFVVGWSRGNKGFFWG